MVAAAPGAFFQLKLLVWTLRLRTVSMVCAHHNQVQEVSGENDKEQCVTAGLAAASTLLGIDDMV